MTRSMNNSPGMPSAGPFVRHQTPRHSGASVLDSDERFMDRETSEIFARLQAQEKEILLLRDQIADACIKELHLLNEKHALESKISDLRKAIDEKQSDAVSDAFKELDNRKSYIEENLKLTNDLQEVEDERYIYTSSLLSLLAEYNVRPPVINASAITNGAKHLYHQLQWRIRTSHASVVDMNHLLGYQTSNHIFNIDHQLTSAFKGQLAQSSLDLDARHPYNFHPHDERLEPKFNVPRFVQGYEGINSKDVNIEPTVSSDYPRERTFDAYKEVDSPTAFGPLNIVLARP
ncbi:hypothetical protein QJS10_CPA10g01161 [Acorus calamus]|uniref:Uncharacterized protein n=1 Tax=Acorus calamus TaxID=4465 RepID=A0AAV9DYL8_ACOCL|nr:hypothetical protein QJS10_CPA10g01161 [Acorus calamus]